MMDVSLVLSVRQLHDGQNHLSDFKISGFKNLEKGESIFGDNGIVTILISTHLVQAYLGKTTTLSKTSVPMAF